LINSFSFRKLVHGNTYTILETAKHLTLTTMCWPKLWV